MAKQAEDLELPDDIQAIILLIDRIAQVSDAFIHDVEECTQRSKDTKEN